jgi:lipoprotein-releasing system ATP-binding protein
MSNLLEVRGVHKSYHDGERELKVLRGVDLDVRRGEAVAIVGMSGSGKSTMLHLLGGLDRPDKGEILFEGKPLAALRAHEYRNREVGFVFQFHHLLPEFTAVENAMMPALMAGRARPAAEAEAREALEALNLGERLKHRPSRLSGGEQQRVALARALTNKPALLLADEPTGNLDAQTGNEVIRQIWANTTGAGRSLIIVTHEPLIAQRADRIFWLRDGKLQAVTHEQYAREMAALRG